MRSFFLTATIVSALLLVGLRGFCQSQGTVTKPSPPMAPVKPSFESLMNAARQAYSQNKLQDAANVLRQATQLYPDQLPPHELLASIDLQLKNYTEAETEAQKAITLAENQPAPYELLAEALSGQKKYAAAEQALRRAIALEPSDASLWLQLGNTYVQTKNYHEAAQAYLDALGLSPDSLEAHAALGDVYEQLNEHDRAVLEYEAALHLLNQSPLAKTQPGQQLGRQIQMGLANALAGTGRYLQAENLVKQLIAQDPKNADALATLAEVYDTEGKHQQAIETYQQALALNPKDAILWGNLGWAQYNAGDYDAAIASSEKALQLDKTLAYVQFNLGLIYAVKGDWARAKRAYDAGLAVASRTDITSALSDIYHAMSRDSKSVSLREAYSYLENAYFRTFSSESNLIGS
ncbi:tetratricopeptide repeat protein,tetratricopeptide repeat protein [Chthonomonas calidirosea]|uniref:Tetratricopeptide repeat./TPR repeat n=1 Tax=Chthonomonas calidirosea (strain DSM 23976 / ICMP 18418 / T49) TaxID=1303518 RepID=S0EV95_CHTCT|nr:tetratricopeptide repeat protein [Chthonomonas calidirosea]CCW34272.1 Tetratricopeptide repeat./TPR repeat [Chthonomonas calidirosea T49]CEK15260.1 tetratricopeptide repeat protein,tetratricopeptide repeat protein [Chthonomonas calidirosea]